MNVMIMMKGKKPGQVLISGKKHYISKPITDKPSIVLEERTSENIHDVLGGYARALERIRANSVLSPAYRRRKIMFWLIRTVVLATLYIIFWEYQWIRWTLLITAPISFVNIASIYAWKYLLQQKIERNKLDLQKMETTLLEGSEKLSLK